MEELKIIRTEVGQMDDDFLKDRVTVKAWYEERNFFVVKVYRNKRVYGFMMNYSTGYYQETPTPSGCSLLTFHKPLTPSFHTTKKSDLFVK